MNVMRICFLLIIVLLISGCMVTNSCKPTVITAEYTTQPVMLDSNFDQGPWANTPNYNLNEFSGRTSSQPGHVKFLWNDDYLFVGVSLIDYDIVATEPKDQKMHFIFGDVIEVFVKPVDDAGYWEFYGTPFGSKSSFYFPSRGRRIFPDAATCLLDNLNVTVKCNGTLNNWQDKDHDWRVLIAIPLKELDRHHSRAKPVKRLRLLVARFNYCRYLEDKELSCFPANTGMSLGFHSYEKWGILSLVK